MSHEVPWLAGLRVDAAPASTYGKVLSLPGPGPNYGDQARGQLTYPESPNTQQRS